MIDKQLPVHEWIAVFGFIAILIALGSLSLYREDSIILGQNDQISVRVTGEVENPGYHFVKPGTTLDELNLIVQPKLDAVPCKITQNDTLQEGQIIRYKSPFVTVNIRGAVTKPGSIKLKLGTQLRESLDKIAISPDADLSKVQYREIKRNQQTITIPKKKDT